MNDFDALSRRGFLGATGAGLAAATLPNLAHAQAKDSLTMVWAIDPPTWDPIIRTNPGIQAIYKMVS